MNLLTHELINISTRIDAHDRIIEVLGKEAAELQTKLELLNTQVYQVKLQRKQLYNSLINTLTMQIRED